MGIDNRKLRVVILASGEGTNFEALVHASRSIYNFFQVCVLIVNNPNCKAISRAKSLNIPHYLINHKDYLSRNKYDLEIIRILEMFNIEAVVMAGWMRIVTSSLINRYADRLLNIHPSLLPSFRGLNAVEQALKANVKIWGCSVHLVRAEVDTGPILVQAAVPVYKTDDQLTLSKRIQLQEHRILPMGVAIAGKKWRK